ncbi:hypothetical protein [Pseudorhodoplanes sinuspersici]|uniref:Uncharacterized protein n=1 Tax=Pseudorhodoplanes sinuspersici TaxID=1235591 RepID=A0A1W6ZRN5_9HYPH|nr:hypothetical protein [Pseudorhodoplanes sinuspersici]ARQ00079.1 hypothetical protein CAK95_14040 [Pseudorhodoplanes sinuspersici]RKE71121.1 hypothetical protein DFP91_3378 [Pseudorhodoplanes sinuspersici]
MIGNHMRAIALTVACITTSISTAPSARAASFDGNWSVVAQTPDHCGTTRWMVSIVGGQVFHPYVVFVGGWPATLNGRVSPSGRITIQAVAGPRVATGTGRMARNRGQGRWAGQGPSGTCAGVWTATRLAQPVAPPFYYTGFNVPPGSVRR